MPNLYFTKFIDAPLYVTGYRGDNFSNIPLDQPIAANQRTKVAEYDPSGRDSWGWIFLGTRPGEKAYQIYVEHHGSSRYRFFGRYDANSSQSDSNPKPFDAGIGTAFLCDDESFQYTLYRQP